MTSNGARQRRVVHARANRYGTWPRDDGSVQIRGQTGVPRARGTADNVMIATSVLGGRERSRLPRSVRASFERAYAYDGVTSIAFHPLKAKVMYLGVAEEAWTWPGAGRPGDWCSRPSRVWARPEGRCGP
jgi:hypothetical protein